MESKYSHVYKCFFKYLVQTHQASKFFKEFDECVKMRQRLMMANSFILSYSSISFSRDFSYKSLTLVNTIYDLVTILNDFIILKFRIGLVTNGKELNGFLDWYEQKKYMPKSIKRKEEAKERRLNILNEKKKRQTDKPFYDRIMKNSFYGRYGANRFQKT